jgi:hypothetical protein
MGFSEALGLRMQIAAARIIAPMLPRSMLPDVLPRSVQPVVAELNRISRLNDPRNTYMYCLACTLD